MKCVKCGKRLKNNEKFCTYCGYYNDNGEKDNWSTTQDEEDLLDENWYDDDVDSNDDDDEVIIEPVKKEKKKKEKVVKEKKEKEEKPKKEKKEKEVKEVNLKEDDEVYDQNERYIEAYIGEDYKLIKKSPFNIWAFLLNWMYFLYRKLYITGVVGLIITALVAFFFTKYFLIYLIVTLLVLGFGFNYYYVFIIKRRVNKILEDYEGSDSFSLEKMCKEFGGVNVIIALIIYLVFLVVIVLSIIKPIFNTSHNIKYWKENSENEANCLSLIRLTYQEEKSNYDKINEALCKVDKNNNKYDLYLKTTKNNKLVYVYYETDNNYIKYKNNTELLDSLKLKKTNKTITTEESKLLSDMKMVVSDYEKGHTKSIEEDKQIKNKTNKQEKLNYIFSYEEIVR
jgi:hypothetical protein